MLHWSPSTQVSKYDYIIVHPIASYDGLICCTWIM